VLDFKREFSRCHKPPFSPREPTSFRWTETPENAIDSRRFLDETGIGLGNRTLFRYVEDGPPADIPAQSRSDTVRAVVRALRILDCLAEVRAELGVSDVARRTQLGLATCHRLLSTLCAAGYAAQSPQSGRYLLGYRTFAVASDVPVLADNLLLAHGAGVLSELTAAFGETSNLAVRDGVHARFVAQAPSKAVVRMVTVIGDRIPLHASAVGKAIIAHAEPEVLDQVLVAGLNRQTPRSIVDPRALMSTLEAVRLAGVAIDNEEFEEGLTCVAAPVFDHNGSVRAGISVSGPTSRMSRLVPKLQEAVPMYARRLSGHLGFRGDGS
jgi:IclR family transcriptional regulator, KDG regulon repressor